MLRFVDLPDAVRNPVLKARDFVLDLADRPFHEELFIKAHTGGVPEDGVLRQLPDDILRTVKRMAEKDRQNKEYLLNGGLENSIAAAEALIANPETATNEFEVDAAHVFLGKVPKLKQQAEDTSRSTDGSLSLYTSGNREAHLGLGTIGLYYDKDGNVLIKDKWKVDGSEDGRPMTKDGKPGLYGDLAEGGFLASDAHDLAKSLGTYKDIPIEIRLTKEEWDAIEPDTRRPNSPKEQSEISRTQSLETQAQKRNNLDFVDLD